MTHRSEHTDTVGIDLRDVYEATRENGRRIAQVDQKVEVLTERVDQQAIPMVEELEDEVSSLKKWKKAVPASLVAAIGAAAGWIADTLEIIHIS